jgi:hypothetical protein
MNNLPACLVLWDMRIHRQNGPYGALAARQDNMTDAPSGRLRWRPRRRRDRGSARHAPGSGTAGDQAVPGDQAAPVRAAPGETVAAAMQLAIAMLTAGLDSPELEAWAADALTPLDADGLADFMAGLHVVSVLLNELHEATGELPAAILQRLAILAEHERGHPPQARAVPLPYHRRLPRTGTRSLSSHQRPGISAVAAVACRAVSSRVPDCRSPAARFLSVIYRPALITECGRVAARSP